MRNLRTKLICLLLLVILLPLSGLTAQDIPTLNIAVLDDPNGPLMNGAQLAVRQINAEGGVAIDAITSVQLNLLPVLSTVRANPAGLVEALRAQDVIAVLGPITSDEAINLIPQLVALGVPIITPATSDTLLTSDASGLVFRSRAADIIQGQALAAFLVQELGLRSIATAQMDIASTAQLLGFATSVATLGVAPSPAVFITDANELPSRADQLITANPDAILAYGDVPSVATLYTALKDGGWNGLFVYPNAARLTRLLPDGAREGLIGTATWAYTFTDALSVNFLNLHVRTYGEIPSEITAAGFDSIRLLAEALALPNDLRTNLLTLPEVRGLQGVLAPAALANGETNEYLAITRLTEFGAPEVIAQYRGGQLLEPGQEPVVIEPTATPLPEGTFITITSTLQNVRSGPSMDYPILGQLNQGDQAEVVGRSIDNQWVVIEFIGDPGWLVVDLLQVTGNLNDVPVVAPPTPVIPPTPVVQPTATPAGTADVIIQSAVITPATIISGQTFTISVTVTNIGAAPTGTFAVGGTFAPSNLFLSGQVPALAPGQSLVVNLTGIFIANGRFTSSLIVDTNNQVNEGPVGEQNNIYNLTYSIDRAVLRQASQTLNLGDTLDFEGNGVQGDVNWNADGGLALDGLFGAKLGILSGIDLNAITYDTINPASVTRDSIPRTEFFPGTLIGVITADGNRAVLRVDAVSDTQLTATFKVYSGG